MGTDVKHPLQDLTRSGI